MARSGIQQPSTGYKGKGMNGPKKRGTGWKQPREKKIVKVEGGGGAQAQDQRTKRNKGEGEGQHADVVLE